MLPGVNQREDKLKKEKTPLFDDPDARSKYKLLLVTVGLPARGKSFISQKLSRYLDWLGFHSKVFDICTYRKQILGKFYNHDWYDPDNHEVSQHSKKSKFSL